MNINDDSNLEGLEFTDHASGRECLVRRWPLGGELWLFWKHPDGDWVSWRKLSRLDRWQICQATPKNPAPKPPGVWMTLRVEPQTRHRLTRWMRSQGIHEDDCSEGIDLLIELATASSVCFDENHGEPSILVRPSPTDAAEVEPTE